MKLTVFSALLLAVVAVVAASASASDAVVDDAAQLRHRKLAGRKHGGHAHKKTLAAAVADGGLEKKTMNHKIRMRKMKKVKSGAVAKGEKNGKSVGKQKGNMVAGTVILNQNLAGTSRTAAINRVGNPNGKGNFPYDGKVFESDTGCERVTGGENPPLGCAFLGVGIIGVNTASFAQFGCGLDNDCQSGCCFAGYFGTQQTANGNQVVDPITGNLVPGRVCVDVNIFSGADPSNDPNHGCVALPLGQAILTGNNTTTGL